MASLLLLGGGDGSSSDFYLEYLCRSSFRLFREPLRRTAAPPLSPSTHRLVRAWLVRSARIAPALQRLGQPSAQLDQWWIGVCLRPLARYHQANRARAPERPCHHR